MFSDRPMWCDDFDMDLPKVIPGAFEIVRPYADVVLWTTGHESFGTLNHPDVWNNEHTMLAFFGFEGVVTPSRYVSGGRPIACTLWETFRDAWPHSYAIVLGNRTEGRRVIWDTFALRRHFDTLMGRVRGWGGTTHVAEQEARAAVTDSLERAMRAFEPLYRRAEGRITRMPTSLGAGQMGARHVG